MKVELSRAHITYQVSLMAPAFELPEKKMESARLLYEAFASQIGSLSDLQVSSGTSLSDFVIRLSLFGGLGSVEFRLDSYKGQFEGIRNSNDLDTILQSISNLEKAGSLILPTNERSVSRVIFGAWLKSPDGFDAVASQLNKNSTLQIEKEDLFQKRQLHISGTTSNDAEKWALRFGMEPSINKEVDHLFINFDFYYSVDSLYSSVDSRKGHVNQVVTFILDRAGFQLE